MANGNGNGSKSWIWVIIKVVLIPVLLAMSSVIWANDKDSRKRDVEIQKEIVQSHNDLRDRIDQSYLMQQKKAEEHGVALAEIQTSLKYLVRNR